MFQTNSKEEPVDYIRPYKPRLMDNSALQLNRLLTGGRVRQGMYADQAVSLCATNLSRQALVSPRVLRVTVPQCEFYIQFGADSLEFAMGQFGIPDRADQLTGALKDGVLVAFAESFFGQVFGISPNSVQAMKAEAISVDLQGMSLELNLVGVSSIVFRVFVHPEFVPVAVEWLAQEQPEMREPNPGLAQVTIPCDYILDEFFVAQSVIETLRVNDVVITDAQEHEILVRVSGQLQQKGKLMDDQITLDGYLEEFENEMASTSRKDALAGISGPRAEYKVAKDLFQELPMQLTFHLHRTQMTLESLRQLNAGQCLPVPSESPSEIAICVNGTLFAKGELVQLQDQIGVRIIRFVE